MGTFADSFDFYGAIGDMVLGFWDGGAPNYSLVVGRFSGSIALQNASGGSATTQLLVKSSGSNDATHHINVSFLQSTALGTANVQQWITFFDSATAQCSIGFRGDGSIVLVSGASSGSVLGTAYSSAFVANVWANFEFEVTINSASGAWHVRKDGVGSDSHSDTSLNTRGGTANNYANKIVLGSANGGFTQKIDDLVWDYNSTTWRGDGRMIQLMPVSNGGTIQFTPAPYNITTATNSGTSSRAANAAQYTSFIPSYSGTVQSFTFHVNANVTGNVAVAILADSGASTPGVSLASTTVNNPTAGANIATLGSPPSVTSGTRYWVGVDQDTTVVYNSMNGSFQNATVTYASFPTNNPSTGSVANAFTYYTLTITPINFTQVDEVQQDGTTTFISDSTVGDQDIYNLADLPYTPLVIGFVQARAMMWKSDAGAKTGGVAINSGTVATSGTLVLSTSSQWAIVSAQTVDPNTGSAWAASAVNALTITGSVVA